MAGRSPLSVDLEPEVERNLDALAAKTRRTRADLAAEAIANFVATQSWQIKEIEQAVKEADEGAFLTEDEIEAAVRRWVS